MKKKRRELFDQISQIETTGNYVFIDKTGYYSKDKEIKFQNLVEEKLDNDGKIVKDLDVTFSHYEDDTIQFFAKYKKDRNFLGLNKQNKRFVVGTISLIDYMVTPHYFRSKYEEILDFNLIKTHHIVTVGTMKKRTSNKEYTKRYVTIDRKSGDTKEWANELDALESIGECTNRYQNPINIENNTEYIPTPSVNDVMEKSLEMKEIIEILGGESDVNGRMLDYNWVLNIRNQCINKNVSFTFRQCGTHFLKEGKMYTIPKIYLTKQARLAGIDFQAK